MSTQDQNGQHRRRRLGQIPEGVGRLAVLWTASSGVQCVLAHYDETRYQLRLLRNGETIKADLFANRGAAIATSEEWHRHIEPFRL
jgi:hypothetical protein